MQELRANTVGPSRVEIFLYNMLVPFLACCVGGCFGGLAGFSWYGAFFVCSFSVNFLGTLTMVPRVFSQKEELSLRYHDVAWKDLLFHEIPYTLILLFSLVWLAFSMVPNVALANDGVNKLFSKITENMAVKIILGLVPWLGAYAGPAGYLGSKNMLLKFHQKCFMPYYQKDHAFLLMVKEDLQRLPFPAGFRYVNDAFFSELYSDLNLANVKQTSHSKLITVSSWVMLISNFLELPLWLYLAWKGYPESDVPMSTKTASKEGGSITLDALSSGPRVLFYMDSSSDMPAKLAAVIREGHVQVGYLAFIPTLAAAVVFAAGSSKGFIAEAGNYLSASNLANPFEKMVPAQLDIFYKVYWGFMAGVVNLVFELNTLNDVYGLMKTHSISFFKALIEKIFPHWYKLDEMLPEAARNEKSIRLGLANGPHAIKPKGFNQNENFMPCDLKAAKQLRDSFWEKVKAQQSVPCVVSAASEAQPLLH